MTSPRLLCLAVVLGLALPGCRSGWELGRDHYRDARYPDALRELAAAEDEFPELSREEQAHFALYRGLSYLAVGDSTRADAWLSIAKRELDTHPETFSVEERGRLITAWQSMGRMPGVGAYGQPWFAGAPRDP